MKYLIYTYTLSLLALSSCKITDKNEPVEIDASMIDSENPPVMTFDKEGFDFGTMSIGSTISHTFKFTNTGKSALILFDVKPSCGCTVLKGWPKNPIPPGESAEIHVEFTPKVAGATHKSVSIVANTNPSVTKLPITGQVVGVE